MFLNQLKNNIMAGIESLITWSAGPSLQRRYCVYSKLNSSVELGYISAYSTTAIDQNGNTVNVYLYSVWCTNADDLNRTEKGSHKCIAQGLSSLDQCKNILQQKLEERLKAQRLKKQQQDEQDAEES